MFENYQNAPDSASATYTHNHDGQNRTKSDTFRWYDLPELAYRIESHCRTTGYKRDSKGNWNKPKHAKGEAKYSVNPRLIGSDGNMWGAFHTWNGDESGSNVDFANLAGIEIPYLDGPATPPDPEEKRRREEKAKRDRAERLKSEAQTERAKRSEYQQHIDRFNRAVVFDGNGSPYCDRKEGMRELFAGGYRNPDIRIERDGTLLVAGRNAAGEISFVQEIRPGWKHHPKDSKLKAVTLALREPVSGSADVRIAEGLATAAEVLATLIEDGDETTGVFVAFFCHNLKHAVHAIHARYPDAGKIILDSDDDFQNPQGNVGLKNAKAAAKAVGGFYTVPDFEGVEGRTGNHTDFDDLHTLAGRDRVRESLARLIAPPVDDVSENPRQSLAKSADVFNVTAAEIGVPAQRRGFLNALNGSECDTDHKRDEYGWSEVKMWRLGQRLAGKDKNEPDYSEEGTGIYSKRMGRVAREEWKRFDEWQKVNCPGLIEYEPGGKVNGKSFSSRFRNGFLGMMVEVFNLAKTKKGFGAGKEGRIKALRKAASEVADRRKRVAEIMKSDEPAPEKGKRPSFAAAAVKADRTMLKAFEQARMDGTDTQHREWAAKQFERLTSFVGGRAEYRLDVDEAGREVIREAEICTGITKTEQEVSFSTRNALFELEIIRQALDRFDRACADLPELERASLVAARDAVLLENLGTKSVPKAPAEQVEDSTTYENAGGGDFKKIPAESAPRHPVAVSLIEQLRAPFQTADLEGRRIITAIVERLEIAPSDETALDEAARIVAGEPPATFHHRVEPSEPVYFEDAPDNVPDGHTFENVGFSHITENVSESQVSPEPATGPTPEDIQARHRREAVPEMIEEFRKVWPTADAVDRRIIRDIVSCLKENPSDQENYDLGVAVLNRLTVAEYSEAA